jgi:hypothetical protein
LDRFDHIKIRKESDVKNLANALFSILFQGQAKSVDLFGIPKQLNDYTLIQATPYKIQSCSPASLKWWLIEWSMNVGRTIAM